MLKQKLRTGFAALAIVAVAATLFAGNANAYSCKNISQGAVGSKNTKFAAKHAARKKWTSTVKSRLGLAWSVWSIAKNKTIRCKKVGSKWRCIAKAKPCLYVVP